MDFHELRKLKRINLIGTSGSGKSTVGREVAALLGLPYFEMDQLFWKPNWEQPLEEEFVAKVREVTSRKEWVLDGNYTRTIPVKWKQVELVIWLDLPFSRIVLQVTRRAVRLALTQDELWPGTGNREGFSRAFLSKNSIIWWAITSYRRQKKRYDAIMRSPEFSHIHFVRLKSPAEIASFLNGLRSGMATRPQAYSSSASGRS